jgi:NodT family efflux transporter outer membrane factor (OMF) lipoprotein
VTLPEAWTAAETEGGSVEEAWWPSFEDETLAAILEEALENNRDLSAAAARVEAAIAQARIVGADQYPDIGAGLQGARRKQNFIGLPIPGSGDDVLSTTTTTWGLSLDVSWEADIWGRIRAGTEAAIADAQAARSDYDAARLSLAGQTAKLWFSLVETRQQLDLARENLESFGSAADWVRGRYEQGLRPSVDLRLALSQVHAAEAIVQQRLEQAGRIERQLEVLLGRYAAGAMPEELELPALPGPVPAGLPAEILSRRPDLAAAERRVAAADRRLAQARRSLYPRLTLTGSAGTTTEALGDLLDGDFGVWSIAGGLLQPVFQGGRLRAGVSLAEARTREAVESFASTALNAFAEVETALATEAFLAEQERALADAALQSVAARDLTERRYASGLENVFGVLEAQRRAFDAESAYLTVRRLRLDNRVDLHLALGGSFETGEVFNDAPLPSRIADVEVDPS